MMKSLQAYYEEKPGETANVIIFFLFLSNFQSVKPCDDLFFIDTGT